MSPCIKKVFNDKIFNQENFEKLKDIDQYKKYPSAQNYEFLRQSESKELTEQEAKSLEMLLKSLIAKHSN